MPVVKGSNANKVYHERHGYRRPGEQGSLGAFDATDFAAEWVSWREKGIDRVAAESPGYLPVGLN